MSKKRKALLKRILALTLIIAMVLGYVPTSGVQVEAADGMNVKAEYADVAMVSKLIESGVWFNDSSATEVTFTVSGYTDESYQYKLSTDADWTDVENATGDVHTLDSIAITEGKTEYQFRDNEGEAESESFEIWYDKTAPTIDKVTVASDGYECVATVEASDGDAGSGIAEGYSFDGSLNWGTSNEYTMTRDIAAGTIRVKDEAGNVAYWNETVVADLTAPTITSVVASIGEDGVGTVTVTASDDGIGIAEYGYSFDSGKNWITDNYKEYDESETIAADTIQVKDAAGNVATYSVAVNVTADTAVPVIDIISFEKNKVTFTVTDDSSVTVTVNGVETELNAQTGQYEFQVGRGEDYTIIATDDYGNSSSFGNVEISDMDTTNPSIGFSSANDTYYKESSTETITITETNFQSESTTVTVTKDGEEYSEASSSWDAVVDTEDKYKWEYEFTEEGTYVITVETEDTVGNTFNSEVTFFIDTTAPVINGDENVVGVDVYYNSDYTATITVEDTNFDGENAEVNSAEAVPNAFTYTITKGTDDYTDYVEFLWDDASSGFQGTFKEDGDYIITVDATDKAGNTAETYTYSFTVDTTAPEISGSYTDLKETIQEVEFYQETTATITIDDVNFDETDETAFTYIITKDKVDCTESVGFSWVADTDSDTDGNQGGFQWEFTEDGDYVITVNVTDKAGNAADEYTYIFTVDTTAPEVTISFDNNDVKNEKYFSAERTATITVVEHNFYIDGFTAKITATNPDGTDAEAPTITWNNDPDDSDIWIGTITFAPGYSYTFDGISFEDIAKNEADIDYADGTVAANAFVIDETAPTGTIKADAWETTWETFLSNITFGLWSDSTVSVTLTYTDELSGLYNVSYITSATAMEYDDMESVSNWTTVSDLTQDKTFTITPDKRAIVYMKITDMSGNVTYLSSNGIIVDNTDPSIEKIAPEVTITPTTQPVNGIYNTNVDVDVKVIDPMVGTDGVYSGLASITYEVINMSTVTQSGTLYQYDGTAASTQADLMQVYSKAACITVDKTLNNSNDVVIRITATDNAGNKTVEEVAIQIDTTLPTIAVSYDNNSQDATFAGYFDENRTATIVVTERNFDADNTVVTVVNKEGGSTPSISGWTKSTGSGNGDSTTYTATITYSADGIYTFDITTKDLAGNASTTVDYGSSVAPTEFTIDKTDPVISVSYSNNDVKNGNYYSDARTATITINEHNFDASRVVVAVTATDDGQSITAPTISSWSTSGDSHTATITYSSDALYSFDIDYTDKAGNIAADYAGDEFYVDTTVPSLEIAGVEDKSANKGTVSPTITYSDTNFDDAKVTITLTGASRGDVALVGTSSNITNGEIFQFANFTEDKATDDIYTLSVTIEDKAGNVTTETIVFSVNRFGSTYTFSAATEALLNQFMTEPADIEIIEVNADMLSDIKVTIFKDGVAIVLSEDQYSVDISGGDGQWYEYTYTIFASNFEDDAIYSVSVYSVDAAGNVAENTLDTKVKEVSFAIDKTAPNLLITNLEDGVTYPVDLVTVLLSVNDNMKLSSIIVELDGEIIKEWTAEEIEEMILNGESFTFDITDFSDSAHDLVVTCIDSAGNVTTAEVSDFYVTTNLWVRFYNNKPLFYGTIFGLILVGGAIVFIVVKKRKKDDEEQ